MFTDISSGFFEKAAERFADAGPKMTFKTLDVEKSIADQGYTANSYDVSRWVPAYSLGANANQFT